jgi:hypothetical protein
LSRFFLPAGKPKHFRIFLDDMGKFTWLSIDGNNNVADICNLLEQEYKDQVEPVDERVTKFLMKLYEQRFITFREITRQQSIDKGH